MAHGDITHIDIPVADSQAARTFYGDLFGWNFMDIPGFEGYPMWRAPNDVSGGGLAPRGDGFTHPRSYVEVDSIDEVLEKVRTGGGTVQMERTAITDTSWFAVFLDPDGNPIGLYEGTTN